MFRAQYSLAVLALVSGFAQAGDWPQWRGPNRDDKSTETGLKKDFKEAPKVLWKIKDAGVGYSGPSVRGGKVYLTGGTPAGEKHNDEVFCLDAATGKQLWRVKLETVYDDSGSDKTWGGGPRSNPTVTEDGKIYTLGIRGDLYCLDAKDGKVNWKKSYTKDLGGKLMSGWGFSESPLVDGDKIVCIPGGSKGSIVALDRHNGKLLWQTSELKDDAAYSSLVKATLSGVEQYVTLTGKNVVGIAAETGKVLWKYDCASKYRVAVIPTPVIVGPDLVFATSGYGAGCDLIRISGGPETQKAEAVYSNKDVVNHHGGVIFHEGHIYGHSDTKGWICQDVATGKLKWELKDRKSEKGSVTYADGALYCYCEGSGDLFVLEASPSGAKEIGRFKLPETTKIRRPQGKNWTHPVISNGKLFLRDQDILFCFDISGKE